MMVRGLTSGLGISAAWTFFGEEFRDFTLALGSDDGGARSVSHGCLRARGRRSGTTALPFRPERSGAGWPQLVAGSFAAVSPDAGSGYGTRGFGPKQLSRHVLDHGADADASREQWL